MDGGWDLVVIGAGPAGAGAARAAADAGLRVLVLEAERLPRSKACAGVLPAAALALAEERFGPTPPGALEAVAVLPRLRVHLGLREAYDVTPAWPAVRVRRRAFDAHLAAACGAEVRAPARVEALEPAAGGVTVRLVGGEPVGAALVVLAAGAVPSIAGHGPSPRQLAFGGLVRYPTRNAPEVRHELLLLGQPALTTLDPDGPDGVTVATVVKDPRRWKEAHVVGLTFAAKRLRLGLQAEHGAEFGWALRGAADLGRGRVLCAGDAAGLSYALGLGLEPALRSGLAAGRAAALALAAGAPDAALGRYAADLEPVLRRWRRERRASRLLRGDVACLDDRTRLARAAEPPVPLARRVVLGMRLRALVRVLERAKPPPRGFPV